MRVWLRETRISLSPPKSPDVTPATGRKMSFKEGGNIKQTRFYINCTCAKARQGYLTGVLCTRSQLETKPLSTKKINLKSYTAHFCFSPGLGALLGLHRHPHSPVYCWHSIGLHDDMHVQGSREPPLGMYRWGAELRALLGLRPPRIAPQGEGKAGAPWSSGVGMLVKARPRYT